MALSLLLVKVKLIIWFVLRQFTLGVVLGLDYSFSNEVLG